MSESLKLRTVLLRSGLGFLAYLGMGSLWHVLFHILEGGTPRIFMTSVDLFLCGLNFYALLLYTGSGAYARTISLGFLLVECIRSTVLPVSILHTLSWTTAKYGVLSVGLL